VMRRWTASATVYAIAGMPVVAILLGALMLEQPITLEVVAGCAIVIVAVYVGAISRQKSGPAAPARGVPHAEADALVKIADARQKVS
jgi:drug/metabolite transporter (DMT)-like permease